MTTATRNQPKPWSFAAAVRRGLNDPTLEVRPGEGDHEAAISDVLARAGGRRHDGAIICPPKAAILVGQAVGSTARGGALVREAVTVGDVLRPELVLSRLGLRTVELDGATGSRREIAPSRVAMSWADEQGIETPVSELTFGASTARPREVTARLLMSRRFLKNAASAEALIQDAMSEATESEHERAVIAGTGRDGQPRGLLASAEAGDIASTPAAGAVPTFEEVTAELQNVIDAGARIRQLGVLLSAADFEAWVLAERTGGEPALVETSEGHTLAGRPVEFSSELPTGHAICGEFGQVQRVFQGSPEVLVNPFTKSNFGQVEIIEHDCFDVTISRPELLRVLTLSA